MAMNYDHTKYSLIMTIVNRGYAELAMDAARKAGAHGGTVLYARGTGIQATEKFMNIGIQPEKEIVLTLVEKDSVKDIMHAILEEGGLRTKGRGISFTLPVTDLVGFTDEYIAIEDGEEGEAPPEEQTFISDR